MGIQQLGRTNGHESSLEMIIAQEKLGHKSSG